MVPRLATSQLYYTCLSSAIPSNSGSIQGNCHDRLVRFEYRAQCGSQKTLRNARFSPSVNTCKGGAAHLSPTSRIQIKEFERSNLAFAGHRKQQGSIEMICILAETMVMLRQCSPFTAKGIWRRSEPLETGRECQTCRKL